MADCMVIMRQKYRMNYKAYTAVDGICIFDKRGLSEALGALFHLDPHDECIDRLSCGMETFMLMHASKHGKGPIYDKVWLVEDEWLETLSWYLLKKPHSFAWSWAFWFAACFDALDGDKDGYINENEFNLFYQPTNRRDNKDFIRRAFVVFDTQKTGGKISRNQFIKTYVKYFTDPDIAYDDLPLY